MSKEDTNNSPEPIETVEEESNVFDFIEDEPQENDVTQDTDDNDNNEPDPVEEEETSTEEDTSDEDEEVLEEEDEDEASEEDSTDDDEEEDSEPSKPKKKENRFQKRINQVLERERKQKERADDLEKRLAALETGKKDTSTNDNTEEVKANVPNPDAKDKDGEPKYPLGKYDPDYISDLAEFRVEEAQKRAEKKAEEKRQQREVEANRAKLEADWDARLEPAKEKYEDFDEKGEELMEVVGSYDPAYAQYLATQIMDMEYGPDVLYYLGENPDEAQNIMDMGPAKATLELGYLNGKFRTESEAKPKKKVKTSKAPPPPKAVNKGTSQAMPRVSPDTDDLSAYESAYVKKR